MRNDQSNEVPEAMPKKRRAERAVTRRAAGDALSFYDFPGFLIRRMQQIAVSIFFEETKGLDLTPLQYAIISATSQLPGIDQIGLGTRIGLDRTTVVGIVDRLERKGLIERRADSSDRRVRKLFLTPAGHKLLAGVAFPANRIQSRILGPLKAGERAKFIQQMKCIVQHHNGEVRVPIRDPATRAIIGTRER